MATNLTNDRLVSLMLGLNLDGLRGNNLNERHGTVSGANGVVFETATDENAWAIPKKAPGAIIKVRFGLNPTFHKITPEGSREARVATLTLQVRTGHHCKRSPLPRSLGNHGRGQRRPTSRCQMPLFTGAPTLSRNSSHLRAATFWSSNSPRI
jgi:hypothetical protein